MPAITAVAAEDKNGAFTGATAARTGAIEAAEGGTVFFDERSRRRLPVRSALWIPFAEIDVGFVAVDVVPPSS